jgi:hypothetical protein
MEVLLFVSKVILHSFIYLKSAVFSCWEYRDLCDDSVKKRITAL